MTDDIQISPATVVDDALVAAFARLMPQLDPRIVAPDRSALEQIVAAEATTLLLARRSADGEIVGALTLVTFRIPTGCKAWIEDVVVDQAARGQGLGERLSRAALDCARELGAASVSLTSRAERAAANRLYQRIGFTPRETNLYRFGFEG